MRERPTALCCRYCCMLSMEASASLVHSYAFGTPKHKVRTLASFPYVYHMLCFAAMDIDESTPGLFNIGPAIRAPVHTPGLAAHAIPPSPAQPMTAAAAWTPAAVATSSSGVKIRLRSKVTASPSSPDVSSQVCYS